MKQYILRKIFMAESIQDALNQEKKHKPESVWLDEEWVKNQPPTPVAGFKAYGRTNNKGNTK